MMHKRNSLHFVPTVLFFLLQSISILLADGPGNYNLTASNANGSVPIGSTTQGNNVDLYIAFGPPDNNIIFQIAPSITLSSPASWTFGSGSPNTGSGNNPGAVTFSNYTASIPINITSSRLDSNNITCSTSQTLCTLIPIQIVPSGSTTYPPATTSTPFPMWYFDGQTPKNYPVTLQVQIKSIAPYQDGDSWTWSIVSGSSNYTISPGFFSKYCTITSTATSSSKGDCVLKAVSSNHSWLSQTFVFTIDHLITLTANGAPVDNPKTTFGVDYYQTDIPYTVNAKFSTPTTKMLEYTENWIGTYFHVSPSTTWGQSDPGQGYIDPTALVDHITPPIFATPSPTNPQSPLSSTKVDYWEGQWRFGGTPGFFSGVPSHGVGPIVLDKTWARYIDHGRHE